jgi:hypothetical protein
VKSKSQSVSALRLSHSSSHLYHDAVIKVHLFCMEHLCNATGVNHGALKDVFPYS